MIKAQNNEVFLLRRRMGAIGISRIYVRQVPKMSKIITKFEKIEATKTFQTFLWTKMATHLIGNISRIRTCMRSR